MVLVPGTLVVMKMQDRFTAAIDVHSSYREHFDRLWEAGVQLDYELALAYAAPVLQDSIPVAVSELGEIPEPYLTRLFSEGTPNFFITGGFFLGCCFRATETLVAEQVARGLPSVTYTFIGDLLIDPKSTENWSGRLHRVGRSPRTTHARLLRQLGGQPHVSFNGEKVYVDESASGPVIDLQYWITLDNYVEGI